MGVRGGFKGLDVYNLSHRLIGTGKESINFLPIIQSGSVGGMVVHEQVF